MEQKRAKIYTGIVVVLLLLLAIQPVFKGLVLGFGTSYNSGIWLATEDKADFVRSTGIVPFAAVMLALLVATAPFTLVWRSDKKPVRAYPYLAGTVVFVAAQVLIDRAVAYWKIAPVVLTSRIVPYPGSEAYNALTQVPWHIKAHYYLFALVLVWFATHTIYRVGQALCVRRSYRDRIPVRELVLQSTLLALYTCICIFGAVVDFSDYGARMLTPASAAIATACNLLAPVLVGLCLSGMPAFRYGRAQAVPAVAAFLTALLVLLGRMLLLGSEFYHLGKGPFFRELLPGISPADMAVILLAPCLTLWLNEALARK